MSEDHDTPSEWTQVGTVEILRFRIYPLDPQNQDILRTEVAVEPGSVFPLYRKYDAFMWLMQGRINERTEKIGDGLFAMNNGDKPTGLEVQFPSKIFGAEQFEDLLTDPAFQPGPEQRVRVELFEAAAR